MILKIFLFIVLVWLLIEVIEHIIIPLAWLLFRKKSGDSRRRQGEMNGQVAVVREWRKNKGLVEIRGEYWSAFSESRFKPGQEVYVKKRDGLKLHVIPYENKNDIKGIVS